MLADGALQEVEDLVLAQDVQYLLAQLQLPQDLGFLAQQEPLELRGLQEGGGPRDLLGVHAPQLFVRDLTEQEGRPFQRGADHVQRCFWILLLHHDLPHRLAQQQPEARRVAHDVTDSAFPRVLPAFLAGDEVDESLVLELLVEPEELLVLDADLPFVVLFDDFRRDDLVIGDRDEAPLVHQDVMTALPLHLRGHAAQLAQFLGLLGHDVEKLEEFLLFHARRKGDAVDVPAAQAVEEGEDGRPDLVAVVQLLPVHQEQVVRLSQGQLPGLGQQRIHAPVSGVHRCGDHVAGGGIHVYVDGCGIEGDE